MLVSKVRQFVVYLGALFLVANFGCGPKGKPLQANAPAEPEKEIKYESEAKPTVVIPPPQNNVQYQAPPTIITNTSNSAKPIEIILGSVEIHNAKISYTSVDRKMKITGNIAMLNDNKEKMAEKTFSLTGTHTQEESNITLHDEIESSGDKKIAVKAIAHCLAVTARNNIDCSQVVIDVYILFNNKYYTEQLEIKRSQPSTPPAIPEDPKPPVTPPIQHEDEDQSETQQSEDGDDSIDGRYQGGAATVDLPVLFNVTAPVPAPGQPPATPASNDSSQAPTTPNSGDNTQAPVPPTAPAKPPQDRPLNPDLQQTQNGEVRPINQAIGFPDAGSLRNATSVLTRQEALNKKAFFEVVSPDRKKHFATYEMAEIITRIGEQLNRQYTKKLYVSNISAINGGKLNPHASHQNGLDVDLGYPSDMPNLKFPLVVRMSTGEFFTKNYSTEKTYNLFKYIFSQNDIVVDRIFIDAKIKKELCDFAVAKNEFQNEAKDVVRTMFENLQHVKGHGDHFHLRIKCSKYDPGCRSRIYRKMETCGK
ncbi:penicillin-insensitive murein endopeptidase [bacterium]|nr:penicillin-insensitive murein endopeptidase [bacterium]